jgi:C-terminal processing protease CtpA/Prc
MINKELKNKVEEIETLTADDEKLHQLLGGLKKVAAPKNFDFQLKARIANAQPNDLQKPFLLPWLRYVLPLSVVVLLAGFVIFNLSFSVDNTGAPQVADLPKNQTETANAPVETPSNVVIEERQIASVPANTNSDKRASELEFVVSGSKAAQTKARTIAVKNSLVLPNNKRVTDLKNNSGGFRDSTLKEATVLFERNTNPNSGDTNPLNVEQNKIPLQQVLSEIGIEAAYAEKGWKIISIKDKSIAMLSDMKVGDLIETIDDTKLSSDTVFQQAFTVKVFRILRQGKQIVINLSAK